MSSAITVNELAALYEKDETAWLEAMADRISHGRRGELDFQHLGEYLLDMARRDKRETFSRLVVLLTHLLKWHHQPDQRSNSWRGTITMQRLELSQLLASGTLRRYALEVFEETFRKALEQAVAETGLGPIAFPVSVPWSFEEVLSGDLA